MPGIFGIISKRPKDINIEELKLMSESSHVEAYYGAGNVTVSENGVYVGWTCHKGSFSDCMPVTNEKKDIMLVYYGENFKDIEEIDELKGRNHSFNKRNASYLVHMYEEWGDKFLTMLNGHFHGILIDKRSEKTILFNDRYGSHRLYYYINEDAFYFSTEAKAILRILSEPREIEERSLAELFAYNCVLENRSLFKNVNLLPAGSSWIFHENDKVEKRIYFDPVDLEAQPLLEKEFHYERLVNTLRKLLKRYFKAEDSIGIRLSEDLDVRIILANALYGPEKTPCYSIGGIFGNDAELKIAHGIVKATGQKLQVINLDENILKKYSQLAQKAIYISDGNMDITGAADLFVNEIAREIAPVQVSANFGGAILRKEQLIHPKKLNRELFSRDFRNALIDVNQRREELLLSNLTFNMGRAIPWAGHGKMSIEQAKLLLRTPFLDNDFVELMYRAPEETTDSEEISIRLIKDGNPLLARKGGIGKEGIAGSMLNYMTKKISCCFQGKEMEHRRDNSPYPAIWYRNELASYVRDILLDKRSLDRPYINKIFLEQIIKTHTEGKKDFANEITAAITAELIHRIFVDNYQD